MLDVQSRLTRILFWAAFGGGLVVWALSWYAMNKLEDPLWEDWYAFAASLGASAIWWAVLARYAEREILALVRTTLHEEQRAAEQTRRMEVELLKAELERQSGGDELPAAIYEGKENWDLRFNRDLTAHLNASNSYVFRGPTGVYVGARLALRTAARPLRGVEVTITDPTSRPAMQLAIQDRMNRPDHVRKPESKVEEQLRDDIFMAVIGLYDARTMAKAVHIVHDRRATRVRAELFDEALYDSDVDTHERKNFTHTVRWDRGQSTFTARDTILRARGEVEHLITFRRETTEAQMLDHLEALGMDRSRLEELRDLYRREYVLKLERVLTHVLAFSDEISDDG